MRFLDRLRSFFNDDEELKRQRERARVIKQQTFSEAREVAEDYFRSNNLIVIPAKRLPNEEIDADLLERFDEIKGKSFTIGLISEETLKPPGYESFDIVGFIVEDVYLFRKKDKQKVIELDLFDTKNPIHRFESIYHALIFYTDESIS